MNTTACVGMLYISCVENVSTLTCVLFCCNASELKWTCWSWHPVDGELIILILMEMPNYPHLCRKPVYKGDYSPTSQLAWICKNYWFSFSLWQQQEHQRWNCFSIKPKDNRSAVNYVINFLMIMAQKFIWKMGSNNKTVPSS